MHINFKYCRSTHEPWRNLSYSWSHSRCGKLNHFEWACRGQCRQVPKDDKRCGVDYGTHQDTADKVVAAQESDVVRSKVFISIVTVLLVKLKTKNNQKVDTCEYKIDTGGDLKLMPSRMYRMLFLHTNVY